MNQTKIQNAFNLYTGKERRFTSDFGFEVAWWLPHKEQHDLNSRGVIAQDLRTLTSE